jgi:predicted DNA-binding protein (MmcQ/YjbR family)
MNVESVRKFCMSFPKVREKLQWGENLCFKIGGKIFAILNLGAVPPSICFKCDPERFVELLEIEGIIPAPYLGRYKWVLLESLDVLDDAELEDLVGESYQMVSAKVKPSSKRRKKSH